MKKLIFFFTLLLCSFNVFAQNIGDKVYKEFTVDGKKYGRWCYLDNITEYEYDSKGKISHIKEIYYDSYKKNQVDVNDYFYEYEYDSNGNLICERTIEIDETWYEYDKKGNLICIKDSDGYKFLYEYNHANKLIKEIDFNEGEEEIYLLSDFKEEFYQIEFPKEDNISYEYDSKGRIIHKTEKTIYEKRSEYNENGKLIHFKAMDIKYKDIKDEKWFEYNAQEQLIQSKDKAGGKTLYTYDNKGKCIYEKIYNNKSKLRLEKSHEYDKNGMLSCTKEYDDKSELRKKKNYGYDKNGNCICIKSYDDKSELRWETCYEYDKNGNVLKEIEKHPSQQDDFDYIELKTIYEYEFYPDGKVKVCREWNEWQNED